MPKDHPVSEAIARARAGEAAQLASVNPLILVDTIRTLAILGEEDVLDRAYGEWKALPDGAVHFEAGLAALMAKRLDEAAERFERAVSAERPQPMAWNSLALLRMSRHEVKRAREAIEAGVLAMPGDIVTLRSAALIRSLQGESRPLPKGEVGVLLERFPGHAQLAREAADLVSRWPEKRAHLERRADELDGRLLM